MEKILPILPCFGSYITKFLAVLKK